ncbi:MAG: DUF881 domain-containing protein [Clostridia bacterium]|nr:MAG: DUF881 domain-containing protein [Clostridia bacterium]
MTKGLSLMAVSLALGLLLTVQFQTQQHLANSLEAQSTNNLVTMWQDLNERKAQLEKEVTNLQANLTELDQQSSLGRSNFETLSKNTARLKMVTGDAPVKGPGVSVTITGESSLLYYDIVDLINELWVSGAEAIAINGQRVTLGTAIGEQPGPNSTTVITVDGKPLLSPYIIEAIGDPAALEKGLTMQGGIIYNLNTLYSIYPEVHQRVLITLPGAGPLSWRYARVRE